MSVIVHDLSPDAVCAMTQVDLARVTEHLNHVPVV